MGLKHKAGNYVLIRRKKEILAIKLGRADVGYFAPNVTSLLKASGYNWAISNFPLHKANLSVKR